MARHRGCRHAATNDRGNVEEVGIVTVEQHERGEPTRLDLSRFSLAGRAAVITGASKNIGAAIALGFAQAGADLVLVARGAELLESVAEGIRQETGRQIATIVADISRADATPAIVDFATRTLGRVDILVNNAFSAGSSQAPVLDLDLAVWDQVLETNLLGPLRLCRGFAPAMAASESASIINVVSGSGFLPAPNMGAYGVSKAALWMLTRYLAAEAAPSIRVNALCPGITTPDGEANHEIFRQLLPLVPMRRLGRPEEMVGAAIYLASDAASYTTGEIIFVNGGRPW
jgi:NAD(P)-dependent dehydrogenase (short-subunit alcohol dehydrogenase family)